MEEGRVYRIKRKEGEGDFKYYLSRELVLSSILLVLLSRRQMDRLDGLYDTAVPVP